MQYLKIPFYFSLLLFSGTLLASPENGERQESSEHPDLILRQAFLYQVAGKRADALESYRKYFATGSESAYARSEYARLLAEGGLIKEAVEQAGLAVKLGENESAYVVLLAELLKKDNRKNEAGKLLDEALLRFENDTAVEFSLAEILLESGDTEKAELHYRQALFHLESSGSLAPSYRNMSLWRLANIRLRENDPEGAEPYLTRYLKYNPGRAYPDFVLGYYVYFSLGKYIEANRYLRLAAESASDLSDPGDKSRLFGALARIAYLQEDPDRGTLFRIALSLNSQDTLLRGLRMQWLSQNQSALNYLVPYARSNPDDFFARMALTRILGETEGYGESYISELLRLSELAGRKQLPRYGLRLADEALDALKKLPETEISSARLHRILAYHYSALGQNGRAAVSLRNVLSEGEREGLWVEAPEKKRSIELDLAGNLATSSPEGTGSALDICKRLIIEDPENPAPVYTSGLIHLDRKEYKEALVSFNRALELSPDHPDVLFYRAVTFHEMDRKEESKADLHRMIETGKATAESYNFLGFLMVEEGEDPETSMEYIRKALSMEPMNASYQDSLGWAYYKKKELKKALYHIRFSSFLMEERNTIQALVYDHLGEILEAMERRSDALAAYHRGLSTLEQKARKKGTLTDEELALRIKLKKSIDDLSELNHKIEKEKKS